MKKSFNIDWLVENNELNKDWYDDLPDNKKPNLKEVVTTETTIEIMLDYPLDNEYFFVVHSEKGFTVEKICKTICKIYKNKIYRNNDSGVKYGIWGHDICDLAIEGFHIKSRKGKCPLLLVDIGS